MFSLEGDWKSGRRSLQLNSRTADVSKNEPMRGTILLLLFAAGVSLRGAPAPSESSPTPTVPAAAATAGKDVVHQLNNAFAKAFEIVAPSVVIIEVTKKNDGGDGSSLDDLFFQNQPDENNPRGSPRGIAPLQSEGSGFI
ncbi:MAG TPA: hypothetical protein VLK33_23400, partial [Terriglobales bacterium]|nr:hypothetical protein [Terriglobales bacterium]